MELPPNLHFAEPVPREDNKNQLWPMKNENRKEFKERIEQILRSLQERMKTMAETDFSHLDPERQAMAAFRIREDLESLEVILSD